MYLLWGIAGVDRSSASAWDEDDLGQVSHPIGAGGEHPIGAGGGHPTCCSLQPYAHRLPPYAPYAAALV